jgi:hypothetical protein
MGAAEIMVLAYWDVLDKARDAGNKVIIANYSEVRSKHYADCQ